MKKLTQSQLDTLIQVLADFNTSGVFKLNVAQLRVLGCPYYNHVPSYLFHEGYMSSDKKLIKIIYLGDIPRLLKEIFHFARRGTKTIATISAAIKEISDLAPFSDKELAEELRFRGYNVEATKIITTSL